MTDQVNLEAIQSLGLDFVGNIFFEKSPRNLSITVNANVPKVGVFVKESVEKIKSAVDLHNLKVVQLHGGEAEEVCAEVKEMGVVVWKVFSVDENFDFLELNNYPSADFFLFDTKSPKHGGTGVKFNWDLLAKIDQNSPKQYYLSGGIGPNDAKEIKELNLNKLIGLDLNSKFELKPGIKDVNALRCFLKELRID